MGRRLARVLVATGLLVAPSSGRSVEVTIDLGSARAVLAAIQNPHLSGEEATRIAAMKGNQGLVAKAIAYRLPATTEILAQALLAAAHGEPVASATAKSFRFEDLKPRAQDLSALVDRIESDPSGFKDWVAARVAQYAPKSSTVEITGHLIVGGPSGGFAFGEPVFFLNLAYFSEFEVAKVIMAHELYHAVQGALGDHSAPWWARPEAAKGRNSALAQRCATTAQLFTDLYQEGSASYVGDPLLLGGHEGPLAKKTRQEMEAGLAHVVDSSTLLELSVVGLNAAKPVPYDDVYALGFYVPETLYKLGYAMARAIAVDEGGDALAALLSQPGYQFAARYVALPQYGRDENHPRLGPNVIAAIERLRSGCPIDARRQ
jgi:hypothetical protein